jgi:hypothetical protein
MKKLDFRLLVAIGAICAALGSASLHYAVANHGFEGGAVGGTLPSVTNVLLAGQVMRPGDYLPIVDFSPNYVTGHLLLRVPCDNSDPPKPLVIPIAGHIDELPERTWVAPAQLNYIPHASSPGNVCVYHSHIPAADITAVGDPGAPRITDIGLINLSGKNVVFRTANTASFTILRVLGDINPPNNYGSGGFAKDIPGSPYNIPRLPSDLSSSVSVDDPHHH